MRRRLPPSGSAPNSHYTHITHIHIHIRGCLLQILCTCTVVLQITSFQRPQQRCLQSADNSGHRGLAYRIPDTRQFRNPRHKTAPRSLALDDCRSHAAYDAGMLHSQRGSPHSLSSRRFQPAAGRQGGPAFPPAPAHPRQGECDPLSACEREGEAASLVDQVWRARSPWQHPHLPTALPLPLGDVLH